MAGFQVKGKKIQNDLKYLDIPEARKDHSITSENFETNLEESPIGQR